MNQFKEVVKLNRDVINKASDELGIPEEKIPLLVEKMLENPKSRDLLFKALGEFVGRRAFIGGMAGVGAGFALTGLVGAKTVITDKNVIIDDEWFLKAPAPFSAIVFKDENLVKALDWKGKEIASGTAGVDDATVIQSALDEVVNQSGGVLRFSKATYQNVNLKITDIIPIVLDFGVATLKGDGTNPVIDIQTNPSADYYPILIGGIIDGNNKSSDGIRITDSYHVVLEDVNIVNCNKGINPRLQSYWTESLILDRVRIRNCNEALSFENVGSISQSFGQARIRSLDIGSCTKGIVINQNCSVYRSEIEATIWVPDNGYGIWMDGSALFARWYLRIESQFATATGIYFGTNYDNSMEFYARFYGTFTEISNPNNKGYVWLFSHAEVRVPSGLFREVLKIRDENGNLIGQIVKNTSDRLVIGTNNANVSFWDYGANKRAGIECDTISTTGRITPSILKIPTSPPTTPQAGDVYFDTATGTLYIYDGAAWKSVSLV